MMKTIILFAFTFILSIGYVKSFTNDTISVPEGTAATIDGVISEGEWDDASFVHINGGSKVYFKHTSSHLYLAYDESLYGMSAGMYIDLSHNGGTSPQSDDLWIHGSANAFEFNGDGSTWQQKAPSDWIYQASSTSGTNEFEIALSKFGNTTLSDTIFGVLFSSMDWSNGYESTFPAGGHANCTNPDSWANLKFISTNAVAEKKEVIDAIVVFPNPTTDFLSITNYSGAVKIYNIMGTQVWEGTVYDSERIDVINYSPGIYYLKAGNKTVRFVKC